MLLRMLKKDLARGRVVAATLLLFLLLASLLTSGALSLAAELGGAMDTLFQKAKAPHFVQMHAGAIDQSAIDTFAANRPEVTAQQTVEMLNVSGAHLYLATDASEADSVMENAFVVQNQSFDLLLGLDNNPVDIQPGQVGVPVHYLKNKGLQLGDTVRIDDGTASLSLTVAAFVRDVQMNPSLVSSKRFVLHPTDWAKLREGAVESEYLIEFLLADPSLAGEFENTYQSAGLPQKDTAVTWTLFRLLSALSDGLVVGVILLIALLLMVIALLCLRFTILAAVEQDYREVGVMKAVGLPMGAIRRLYMVKYAALAGAGCLLGYMLSLPLGRGLSGNIALYMGRAQPSPARMLLPALGSLLVFLAIWLFCRLTLGRLGRVSAVEALGSGSLGGGGGRGLRLHCNKAGGVNVLLGLRDVLARPRQYGVLALVFVLCTFLMVLPLNLLTTLSSPGFIAYMGAPRSDIRIDLFRAPGVEGEYTRLLDTLNTDPQAARTAALVTAAYQATDAQGEAVSVKVENGDHHVFPLDYLEGAAPADEAQIALSLMNAQELGKSVGDPLALLVEGEWRTLTVTGIYQDITNGGKTAKGRLPWRQEDVLWIVFHLDVKPGVDPAAKISGYAAAFPSARVLDMAEYLGQTLGGTVAQVRLAAILAAIAAALVAVCVTALFFRMLLAKDAREIAIMRMLGFSPGSVGVQYGARSVAVLLVGVALGAVLVNTLGAALVGAVGGLAGAPGIRLAANPLLSWLACPAGLVLAVLLTTLACCKLARGPADLRAAAE